MMPEVAKKHLGSDEQPDEEHQDQHYPKGDLNAAPDATDVLVNFVQDVDECHYSSPVMSRSFLRSSCTCACRERSNRASPPLQPSGSNSLMRNSKSLMRRRKIASCSSVVSSLTGARSLSRRWR